MCQRAVQEASCGSLSLQWTLPSSVLCSGSLKLHVGKQDFDALLLGLVK